MVDTLPAWKDERTGAIVSNISVGTHQPGNCVRCGAGLRPGTAFFDLRLPSGWPQYSGGMPPNLWYCSKDHLVQYALAMDGRGPRSLDGVRTGDRRWNELARWAHSKLPDRA